MTQLGVGVSESLIRRVTERAAKLAFIVEVTTEISPSKKIREGGAQLIDRLNEWVEEIRDLHEAQDDEIEDRLKSFIVRLRLAEAKVTQWPIPASARKILDRQLAHAFLQ